MGTATPIPPGWRLDAQGQVVRVKPPRPRRTRSWWVAEALVGIAASVSGVTGVALIASWYLQPGAATCADQACVGAIAAIPLLFGAAALGILALAALDSPRGVGWILVLAGTPLALGLAWWLLRESRGTSDVLLLLMAGLLATGALLALLRTGLGRRAYVLVGSSLGLCFVAWALVDPRRIAWAALWITATFVFAPVAGLLLLKKGKPDG